LSELKLVINNTLYSVDYHRSAHLSG